ncbi:MAG: cation transporter [Planctomycetota bacterium]|nr:MAG: cation transporter [Planctomycetota bacterium]REJ96558.1 MAG: cation transporter [Planctomycetota bacterium]REK21758.1 MAG: cation transporter [Planctomycetota bacterium]REK43164.1 MAG: cation transporter [Planctomycetota bacterium]
MNNDNLHLWQHDHSFGQHEKRPGEVRTLIVIAVTATMMVVEVVAGIAYGSMALLADGLHMASHAAALSISAFAYVYARRRAHDERFSFGTGKVNSLGGYTGAVLLGVFALMMVWESIHRLIAPVDIYFNQAILVAVLGLLVNGASVVILGHGDHHHEHGHDHDAAEHQHGDHNLRAAYLHVLADALTSVLAIFALLAGKYFGLNWLDPTMGIVGAALITHWSVGLLRASSTVLLDRQGPQRIRDAIVTAIEEHERNRVADLHLWAIGPQIYAVEISIVTPEPQPPDYYKSLLSDQTALVHVTVEVHRCKEDGERTVGLKHANK